MCVSLCGGEQNLGVAIGAEVYFETSCKTGEGIEEVLIFMERLLLNKVELQPVWQQEHRPASTHGGDTPASSVEINSSSAASVHPKPFLDVLDQTEGITCRRYQLLRVVTEGFESDATRQKLFEQCLARLTNGLEVRTHKDTAHHITCV